MTRNGIELEKRRGVGESCFTLRSERIGKGMVVSEEGGRRMAELERHSGDCVTRSGLLFWASG